ncbi:hypothetical protein FHS00_003521 [Limimaricola variabilis]|uniref:Uncharacterized protein n=1 Tax=Limimaricola variabilis TaxID=1492771 RepID=A0ABR6HTM6_9RHOB|nr:hypothetical protein [Limimaricola variabilis]MBB3713914.1 hypothetical protein [Limimaricola variabilis]
MAYSATPVSGAEFRATFSHCAVQLHRAEQLAEHGHRIDGRDVRLRQFVQAAADVDRQGARVGAHEGRGFGAARLFGQLQDNEGRSGTCPLASSNALALPAAMPSTSWPSS